MQRSGGTFTVASGRQMLGDYGIYTASVANPQGQVIYRHGDRLGSPAAQTDGQGQAVERRGVDAWGAPREGTWTDRPGAALGSAISPRGFTGHEHLDDVGSLIHMNGRAYDPRLGRFLSVDPIIQFPANSQSLNPYSYLMNNPMSGTDPTGYVGCGDVATDKPSSGTCDHTLANGDTVEVGYRVGKDGNSVTVSATASTFKAIFADNGARLAQGAQQKSTVDGGQSKLGDGQRFMSGASNSSSAGNSASGSSQHVVGDRKRRGGMESIRPTKGQRREFMDKVSAERDVLVGRLRLLGAFAAFNMDAQSASDFFQAAGRFEAADILDRTDEAGPGNAEMQFRNYGFLNGEPTAWQLTVFAGAYEAYKRGSPAASGYSFDLPRGDVGLRMMMAHESGHAVSRLNFRVNGGRVEAHGRSIMETNADNWMRRVWPNY